jgi:hypothetical protein
VFPRIGWIERSDTHHILRHRADISVARQGDGFRKCSADPTGCPKGQVDPIKTHNAAQAEYDRLAALVFPWSGAEIPAI